MNTQVQYQPIDPGIAVEGMPVYVKDPEGNYKQTQIVKLYSDHMQCGDILFDLDGGFRGDGECHVFVQVEAAEHYRPIDPTAAVKGTTVYILQEDGSYKQSKIVRLSEKNMQCGADWYFRDGSTKSHYGPDGCCVFVQVEAPIEEVESTEAVVQAAVFSQESTAQEVETPIEEVEASQIGVSTQRAELHALNPSTTFVGMPVVLQYRDGDQKRLKGFITRKGHGITVAAEGGKKYIANKGGWGGRGAYQVFSLAS